MSGGGKTSKADREIQRQSGGVFTSAAPTRIETIYRDRSRQRGSFARNSYDDEVLEAKADANGNVTFSYAKGGDFQRTAKTNVRVNVSYDLVAGAVNGKTFNIDWSKVNSVSGQTYSVRDQAKAAGLKWDGKGKKWVR